MAPSAPLRFRKERGFPDGRLGRKPVQHLKKMDLQEAETDRRAAEAVFGFVSFLYNGSGAVGIRAERECGKGWN